MAEFRWQGNNNLTIIGARLQQAVPQLVEAAQVIVQETVLQGQQQQIAALEDAHTKTGLERQAKGGEPGRDLTGTMIAEVDSDVIAGPTNVSGSWGWNDPEEYFLEQDDGFEKIPAANSLRKSMEGDQSGFGSFVNLREEFFTKVIGLTKGE